MRGFLQYPSLLLGMMSRILWFSVWIEVQTQAYSSKLREKGAWDHFTDGASGAGKRPGVPRVLKEGSGHTEVDAVPKSVSRGHFPQRLVVGEAKEGGTEGHRPDQGAGTGQLFPSPVSSLPPGWTTFPMFPDS